ncbi:MAG: glycosyltransferase [Ardenticatenaceae bacterium]|nr:glycosyltransferase [Ardenticatenaceae bacterium]
MKIWHLVHQYLPEKIGGTELYTQATAAAQAKLGHQVVIITPSSQATAWPKTEIKDDQDRAEPIVFRFPMGQRSPLQVFFASWRSHAPFENWFSQMLTADPPDIIHLQHLLGLPLNIVGMIKKHQIPYVITLHDYWFICPNAQLITNTDRQICAGPAADFSNCGRCLLARGGLPAPQMLGRVTGRIVANRSHRLRPILDHAHRLIAPTHFVKNEFMRAGMIQHPEKCVVLPHGIEFPAEIDLPGSEEENGFRVAYIGGLSEQKGVHILIEAFNRLPPAAQLDIYGDETAFPDYVETLKGLAAHPGITFRGRVPHEEVWGIFRRSSVSVVPTLWYETFSFIVDESMAVGTPVIASDIGVFPEKIRPGVDGQLVKIGDIDHWYKTLNELFQNPDLVDRLSRQIIPPLTQQNHTKQLLNLYEVD